MLTIEMPQPTKACILLTELDVQGKLIDHVQAGLLTARQKKYFDIYSAMKRETSRFKTYTMKKVEVALSFKCSIREVERAMRFMEQ